MCFENLIPIIKNIGQTGNPEMPYYILNNANLIYKKGRYCYKSQLMQYRKSFIHSQEPK